MDFRSTLASLITFVFAMNLAPVARALDPGDKAPQFAAPSLEGDGQVSLGAYKGKVVWVDFWASWCTPCLTAMPLLEKLRLELPEDRFQIVAINVDRDLDKARAFLRDHPVGYPSASDPKGNLPKTYGVETMPTSYLIDSNGVVRHVHRGFHAGDVDDIRKQIRSLLEDSNG
jgi:thiol-disulfide isomerase/thioredoxin